MTQRNWTMSIVESPAASGWPQMPQFRPPVLYSSRRPPWNRRHRRFNNKNTHTKKKTNVTLSNRRGAPSLRNIHKANQLFGCENLLYCFGCSRTSASVIRTSQSIQHFCWGHWHHLIYAPSRKKNQEHPGGWRIQIPNSLSSIIQLIQLLKDNARPNHQHVGIGATIQSDVDLSISQRFMILMLEIHWKIHWHLHVGCSKLTENIRKPYLTESNHPEDQAATAASPASSSSW